MIPSKKLKELQNICKKIRQELLWLSNRSRIHIGSSLSIIELLVVIYYELNLSSFDKVILSKGHAAVGQYAVLSSLNIIPKEDFINYGTDKSTLSGHPEKETVGIDVSTGSLGHGLPLGVGISINQKMEKNSKTIVIIGDGEMGEGSIWESLLLASSLKLDNLYVIIDRNRLQQSSETKLIDNINLPKVLLNMNWEVFTCDGHDIGGIIKIFDDINKNQNKKPKFIIANTVKGKGIKEMEDNIDWHMGKVEDEDYSKFLKQINEMVIES